MDVFKVLQVACLNPVEHYGLDVGLLQVGDPADFVVLQDLVNFETVATYIDGELVAENGTSLIKTVPFEVLNNFNTGFKESNRF